MQRTRGFRLGRPVGFPLLVHGSWLPAGALLIAHLSVSAFGGDTLFAALGLSLLTVIGLFVGVVVHELVQGLVSRVVSAPYADSTLYIFGGVARMAREPARPVGEIVAALVGPLASAGIGYGMWTWSSSLDGSFGDAMHLVGVANLALAAVNLVPGLPLDGGRVLAALMWARTKRRSRGLKVAGHAGQLTGLIALLGGLFLVATGPTAFDETAAGSWLLLTGIFVATQATKMLKAARVVASLEGRTVAHWAKPFAGRVQADAPVPGEGGPFAVAEDGRLAGVLAGDSRPEQGSARDAMVKWTPDIGVRSTEPITTALEMLASKSGGVLVVLDEKGVVRGVLDEESVRAHLRRK